jgi:NAD+ diphosphatase
MPTAPYAASRSWFLVHPKGLLVRRDGGTVTLPTDADAAALGIDVAAPETGSGHLFGTVLGGEGEAVAAPVPEAATLPGTLAVSGLRELYGALGDALFLAAGRATQIVEWAATHRFCGRCAAPTERVAGERCMRCPACELMSYPRISPAIIVLVRRGDEALLARGARFPAAFYSTLAGFAEVGESLEETLAREVREEVGVEVKNARYFGSQPWPFPHSLMIGFVAEWAGGDIKADGKEILDARWFRADALPAIPPPISIARRLIDAWIDDVQAGGRAP